MRLETEISKSITINDEPVAGPCPFYGSEKCTVWCEYDKCGGCEKHDEDLSSNIIMSSDFYKF